MPDGARVQAAGVVLVRQRPGNGKALCSDHRGRDRDRQCRGLAEPDRPLSARGHGRALLLVGAASSVQPEGIVHVVAERLTDRSADMAEIGNEQAPAMTAPADDFPPPRPRGPGHPREERIFPSSRNFH